ncbi:hypothetical protein AcW1_006758 [Taiwanofungus camphoratus]|nr:hypothetical protein AcW1_006758 [Antrodia cinnamomea]
MCDNIIDHLCDDDYTQQACSLTCRAWLPASRSHLFYRIHLNVPLYPKFNALRASPHIALYVRMLSIDAYKDSDGSLDWPHIMAKLIHVDHLSVSSWDTRGLVREKLGTGFTTVKVAGF